MQNSMPELFLKHLSKIEIITRDWSQNVYQPEQMLSREPIACANKGQCHQLW